MTDAMKRALLFMYRGGSGVIDRHGRVVVRGEHLATTPEVYLRLVARGMLTGDGGRLSLTPDGASAAHALDLTEPRP